MNNEFIEIIRFKMLMLRQDEKFAKEKDEIMDGIRKYSALLLDEEITEYRIAFYMLLEDHIKLNKMLKQHVALLDDQKYYAYDISYGISVEILEIRPPEDKCSEWELLYSSFVNGVEMPGPFLHLYFDGWEVVNTKIYNENEYGTHDFPQDYEAEIAKIHLIGLGFLLPGETNDSRVILIKNIMEHVFPEGCLN